MYFQKYSLSSISISGFKICNFFHLLNAFQESFNLGFLSQLDFKSSQTIYLYIFYFKLTNKNTEMKWVDTEEQKEIIEDKYGGNFQKWKTRRKRKKKKNWNRVSIIRLKSIICSQILFILFT